MILSSRPKQKIYCPLCGAGISVSSWQSLLVVEHSDSNIEIHRERIKSLTSVQ